MENEKRKGVGKGGKVEGTRGREGGGREGGRLGGREIGREGGK